MSRHPVDELIRDLVRTARDPTLEEVEQIVQRIATVPFNSENVHVPIRLRDVSYLGRRLSDRTDSWFLHLVQRVLEDRQWRRGTTEHPYLQDLKDAVMYPGAGILIYERQGGAIAAAIAPNMIPDDRRGEVELPFLYVVYSADLGRIITGYQTVGRRDLNIPRWFRWIK